MLRPIKWKTSLDIMTREETEALHAASLRILSQSGILMPLPQKIYDQLADLGVKIDRSGQKVFFSPADIEKALASSPKEYVMCARNHENDLPLDGQHGYLCLDGSGLQIIDYDSREIRSSNYEDLSNAIRVSDSLPQISFLWPCISAQDKPAAVQPLYELLSMLENSSKHAQAMTAVDPLNAAGSIEIAAAVAGGKEALRKHPIISNFQCSLSPLSYDEKNLEAALVFAEAGIPTGFMIMQIACSTAPATMAGSMALGNAEILAGITLIELLYPGTPTFYGSCATMMELKRGGVTCGGPEDFLQQAIACQMARFYKIPSNIGTFATGAKAGDWHAGVENAISGATSVFCRADTMCGAGLLNGAKIFSYEQLLMDCEIYEILRVTAQGIEVNDETLALDVIDHVGPRNHYMTEEHTLKHMRESWQPNVIDRSPYDEWMRRGKPDASAAAHSKAGQLLKEYQPMELKEKKIIEEIIIEYQQKSAK